MCENMIGFGDGRRIVTHINVFLISEQSLLWSKFSNWTFFVVHMEKRN